MADLKDTPVEKTRLFEDALVRFVDHACIIMQADLALRAVNHTHQMSIKKTVSPIESQLKEHRKVIDMFKKQEKMSSLYDQWVSFYETNSKLFLNKTVILNTEDDDKWIKQAGLNFVPRGKKGDLSKATFRISSIFTSASALAQSKQNVEGNHPELIYPDQFLLLFYRLLLTLCQGKHEKDRLILEEILKNWETSMGITRQDDVKTEVSPTTSLGSMLNVGQEALNDMKGTILKKFNAKSITSKIPREKFHDIADKFYDKLETGTVQSIIEPLVDQMSTASSPGDLLTTLSTQVMNGGQVLDKFKETFGDIPGLLDDEKSAETTTSGGAAAQTTPKDKPDTPQTTPKDKPDTPQTTVSQQAAPTAEPETPAK